MQNIFLLIQKKRNFLRIFCWDCWVEFMRKVSVKKNKLYLNFIWALKFFCLFKQKTMLLANIKLLSKNLYCRTNKSKNDQAMGNSELKLKIHSKEFSYLEVKWFQQMIYRIFVNQEYQSVLSVNAWIRACVHLYQHKIRSLYSLLSIQNP